MNDTRPVIAQAWAEDGNTFLTYFFSDEAIEKYASEKIVGFKEILMTSISKINLLR